MVVGGSLRVNVEDDVAVLGDNASLLLVGVVV